jgi:flagellar hook-associated protein 2
MAIPLINFGGLASGLDTNSMVTQLVAVERIPIQQLESKKAGFEKKDAAWTGVATRFSALQKAVDAIKDPGSFAKFAIGTSSSDAVTVTSVAGANPTTASFTVNNLAAAHQLVNDATYTTATDLVGAGDFTVTVDGVDHTVTTDDTTTLAQLATMINNGDSGITASVLKVDGTTFRLTLSAEDTGAAGEFTASGTQANMGTSTILQQAADATITIGQGAGAITVTRSSNTVSDLIDGVTMTLNEVTAAPVSVTVTRDLDAAVEAVQNFVNELNAVASHMKTLTAYNSTTEKAGPLQGDSTARSLAAGLRSTVSSVQEGLTGNYTFASAVGITLTRDGTFKLDTDKLRTALEEEFPDIADFFEGDGTVGGLASAIDAFLDTATGTDGAIERARDRWQAQIENIKDAIVRMEDRVDRREAALIAQFARLETAMSQLGGMAAQLTAALPGLSR